MDLGSESVEENEVNHDDGSFGNENFGFGFHGNLDAVTPKSDHKGTVDEAGSEEGGNSKGTSGKGVGLKKWKRIRRDVVKDPNSSADSGKILKRGLSGNANLSENQPFLRDVKEKGEEGSSNIFGNVEFSDGYAIRGSSTDSRYAVGSGFAVGTDSENSEDRSSKSSTAASQPKLRSEKSRSKNVNSKNLGNSAQRVPQGKGPIESSNKPRGGGRVTMEKENSLSSMESDSRSSNFKQGIFAATSNGNHRGRSNVYDGDNGGEAHTNENFTEGVQPGYGKEKVGEYEDLVAENLATNLPWGVAEERSVNNQSSPVEDTLIESISSLQAVQEALEEEVLKFREIGVEVVSPDDDSAAGIAAVDLGLHNSCLSGQSGAEETKQTASSSMEIQVSSVKQNISILENKLEELQGMLALKDSRIAELEKYKEVESELEGLFKQKIEAEVEYLAITNVMKNLKVGADFQLKLLEKQEKLSENQAEVLNKVIETESKASLLKKKAEELEKYSDDTEVVKKSLELQKGVCKVTFYLFLQVMLLIFFVWLFMSQLSLNSGVVVPT
ncbi:PREDICTED: WPP domain-interacting protein 1-like isoform X1 [Lupinus angustifolius]|uniref:WPP domain-interacting protein 1-like isoform X1 n=1 Tax=Lupinus angustifolius TaxID=3871 RepID=UPI00092F2088|nr:PREDICTED: WPP domain-interacting protein 1-like isoform X1 [Lupinus angustifolius]